MIDLTRLEELSLNSWPDVRSFHFDGWIIRLAHRFTDRSNSVWPLYESRLDPEQKIHWCESLYGSHEQPAIFRIVGAESASPLDRLLAKSGYERKTVTSVQTLSIDDRPSKGKHREVTIGSIPTSDWLDNIASLVGLGDRVAVYRRLLQRIVLPTAFATLRSRDQLAAAGLGVLEEKHCGIYGMVTHPSLRRRGLARRVLNALVEWAGSHGAHTAYLQVEEDNTPAVRLYRTSGFTEAYKYWYRVQPER